MFRARLIGLPMLVEAIQTAARRISGNVKGYTFKMT